MTTNIRCVNLRPHEVRRLLEVGSVRVVRWMAFPRGMTADNFDVLTVGGDVHISPKHGIVFDTPCGRPSKAMQDRIIPCPFGAPGDTVRVREAWAVRGDYLDDTPDAEISRNQAHYEVWTKSQCLSLDGREKFNLSWMGKWRSPATMPAWASRLSAVVDDVRVCRVQGVTFGEIAETGVPPTHDEGWHDTTTLQWKHDAHTRNPEMKWERNPWCWNALITRSDK